jgi:hypothetical protein
VVRRVVLGHAVRLSWCSTARRIHEATDRLSASARRLTSWSTSGGSVRGWPMSAALCGAEKIHGAGRIAHHAQRLFL